MHIIYITVVINLGQYNNYLFLPLGKAGGRGKLYINMQCEKSTHNKTSEFNYIDSCSKL